MLTQLYVRDFVIVEQLELDFQNGLTVLTGETGTGKSIMIEALGLILGDRADSDIVRQGSQRAEIIASFDLKNNHAASDWLKQRELEGDDECQIRRTISSEGRSRGYINGSPQPIQSLKELGQYLVDIHGQHEHQSLLKTAAQRQLLDNYANHKPLLKAVNEAFNTWKDLNKEYEHLQQASSADDNQLDLLRYQTQELKALNITPSELQELEKEHRRLANAGNIINSCQHALNTLQENDQSVIDTLAPIITDLQELLQTEQQLGNATELLDSAVIQLQEAVIELQHLLNSLDLDPQRLTELEERMGECHKIARKHRVRPEALPDLAKKLEHELASLEGAEEKLVLLHEKISQAADTYRHCAVKLTTSRIRAAQKLNKLVSENMHKLGMPGGKFEIKIEALPEERFTATGMDHVEFLVSTNPSQNPRSLTRVVSGGELSRISLAIQVITAQREGIPCLIFDEVDVGIGGRVAEIVGQKLRELGLTRQVLCITHLPQVAAQGHHHLQVIKTTKRNHALTQVQPLSAEKRNEEIARMLGGIEITEQTRAHAQEMIERAQQNT